MIAITDPAPPVVNFPVETKAEIVRRLEHDVDPIGYRFRFEQYELKRLRGHENALYEVYLLRGLDLVKELINGYRR